MKDTPALMRLVYASRSLVPQEDMSRAIDNILEQSRARNAAEGITGVLLFSDDSFLQVLEGPPGSVETLFEAIQLDIRHCEVVVLSADTVTARSFGQWAMAYAGRTEQISFADIQGAIGVTASPMVLQLLQDAIDRMTTA